MCNCPSTGHLPGCPAYRRGVIDRDFARGLIRARRMLLAKVVWSMREDRRSLEKMEELQTAFEACIYTLPLLYRNYKWLEKHILGPATRQANRQGYLHIATAMNGWDLP